MAAPGHRALSGGGTTVHEIPGGNTLRQVDIATGASIAWRTTEHGIHGPTIMSSAHGIPTGEELAWHVRWIRRLAAGLLRLEAAAEDLVQEAWLAALTRPPAEGHLRPWLRRVAANFARQHHRGKARRAAREAVARGPVGPEAPDGFAERFEAE
jgi:hypothetical protein